VKPQQARAAGVAVVVAATVVASVYAEQFPWLTPLASALAWALGKLLGIPVDSVVDAALESMRNTDNKVKITFKALNSLPPDRARTVIDSLAPPAQAQLIELVDSMRPPPPPAVPKI